MYEQYYGLAEKPFNLTPDTGFFYQSFTHKEALNVLQVAIRAGDGFIKVTGEVGTGKTLLCRKLLEALEADFETVYIPNPYMGCNALFHEILSELGITDRLKKANYLTCINEHLIKNARRHRGTIIILDEAQSMPQESLEAIRLLSNLETRKRKLVQIALFGQPELDVKLAQSNARQLKQRIVHAYQLKPLNQASVRSYLRHRIRAAGYHGPEIFDNGAQRRLYKLSQGIPRVINVLCNKALMLSYGSGEFYVKSKHIEAAATDSQMQ